MDEIKHVMTASSSRTHERVERAKAEDFDAEEGELLKEENELEEEIFDQVCLSHNHICWMCCIIHYFLKLLCLTLIGFSFFFQYRLVIAWPH